MRYTHTLAIAFMACTGFCPMVAGILGTSCIGTLNAISDLPGVFVKHLRTQACQAGCEPRFDHWDKYAMDSIVKPLVDATMEYAGAPDGKDIAVTFVDRNYQGIVADCNSKLREDVHFCSHPEFLQPFLDCAKSRARVHIFNNMTPLLPWAKENTCKKATEYLKSSTLSEVDFPQRTRGYMEKCREL
ncbi:hypothetical protein BJX99DRAFT_258202 [Aspergillus californicus]